MSRDQVNEAFIVALDLGHDVEVEGLEIGANPNWDSVGHMALVAELEDRFGIELDAEDIVEMSSFARSLEILRRYGVEV